jgi:hypothetical protein
MEDSPTSPSSKEILEKLEAVIEPNKNESAESAKSVEEYKISILALTIAHGEKIILPSRIKTLEEFQKYESDLKIEPWYTFVEKTYIYGHAPFGNVCLFRNKPHQVWSRLNTKQGIEKLTKRYGVNTTNRKTFVKGANIINTDFMMEPIPDSSMPRKYNIPQKRAPIMAKMYKEELSYYTPEEVGKNVPVSGIMNPMTMRLEIIPSSYILSGKNTDNIEKSIKEAESDKYSGIFVSILSDNRGNSFTFPSLFNLADGKHIMEIYQRLQKPIPGIDVTSANGNELYQVVATYLEEWIIYINSNKLPIILDITSTRNTYYIPDKLAERKKPVNYFMLTRLNTMNVYVLANLVFDFLLFKQTNPTTPYKKTKDELKLWIEELKTKNSKIINISTACESVNPYIMNEKIIQDVAPYINANSLHRTETQIETEEGGPDLIPFAELDNYIAQFEDKVEEEYEYEPLRESLKQPISDEFASPLKREIGGRKRRTIKMNRRKSNKRRRKSNKKKNK